MRKGDNELPRDEILRKIADCEAEPQFRDYLRTYMSLDPNTKYGFPITLKTLRDQNNHGIKNEKD